jgi:hypothetical protein
MRRTRLPPGQIDLFRAPEQIIVVNATHEPNEHLFVSKSRGSADVVR